MEQTKNKSALKVVLAAIFAVAFTLTMVVAILLATTLTAHAAADVVELYTNTKQSSYSSGCVTITVNDPGDGDGAKVDENRLMVISVSENVVIKNAKVRIGYYYEEAGDVRSDVCDEVNVEGSGNHKTYVTFSNVNAKKITISTPFDMVQIDHVSVELIPVNGVTYELNGGSFNGEYIDYYLAGEGLILPTNVTRKQYSFVGWYEDAEFTDPAVTEIASTETGNKVFYAKWEPVISNVTFNANGGEWEVEPAATYTETIGLTLPTNITKAHYTFAGWYDNSGFTGEPVTAIDTDASGNKEFWAKWEHITHNIIYHLNGGEWKDGISAPTTFNEGERFELVGPDCIMPVKTGYMFYGWFTSETLDEESEIQIIQDDETNDVELWAAWGLAPVAPTIEDVFPISGQSEYIGEAVTVEATANENGFVLDKTHSIKITFEEGLFPDHAIYLIVADGYEHNPQPEYIESDNQYNEVFITSSWGEVGHGGYSYDGINILSGPTIGAPWPFDFEAFDGSITVTLSEEYSTKSLAFKQIHVIAHHVRTVTYNENDGKMPEEYANKYLESRGLELPIPTRNAYAFLGWYDNEELEGEAVTMITVADTGNKEYFAKWEFIEVVDLSKVTGDVVIYDGQTITGELKENVQVTIADGARVTLKDVVIKGENNTAYAFAGITLEGDATLILEGENTVVGFQEKYPGIFVPKDKTLTIGGTGTLDVSSNGFAPGIGAGFDIPGGNIVIEGGTINATGGSNSAGIGAGNGMGSCGDITITGGRVTATGGDGGAGIGGGEGSSCGNITITDTVKRVSASGRSANSIGAGRNGTSGTVTVGGQVYEEGISDGDFVYSTATAEEFAELIEHLGEVEYTDAYKEKLDEARELYKELSDEQKQQISAETLKKLTDAEDAFAAAEVTKTISDLPQSGITPDDRDAIEAARAAYEKLTDGQKSRVSSETLKKLTDAEDALAAAEVTKTISDLPQSGITP
ncbi:MAG: InlB B-repeat-containing protein, partial [Clostridia bacterium]|nr:InlB B-repeat-containing protein [Clostridia bacterium]